MNLAAESATARFREPATLTGPIPAMLDASVEWARRVLPTDVRAAADGNLADHFAYPLEAFRELMSNALIHRDLSAWSQGMAIEVRYTAGKLIVTNPGGLYGISADRLGQPGMTSARNALLLELCRHARTPGGGRVVEAVAMGIPRVLELLAQEGHAAPVFSDTGVRFTVMLLGRASVAGGAPSTARTVGPELTSLQRQIYLALSEGGTQVVEIANATGLQPPNIRRVLRDLRNKGLVERRGGKGRRDTVYMPVREARQPS